MSTPLRVLLLLLATGCATGSGTPEGIPGGWPCVWNGDVADLDDLVCSDPPAWSAVTDGGRTVLALDGTRSYTPPVRSPHELAVLDRLVVGDFALEVEMKQTGREYGHRDLCLVFGHRAPDRYFYVHLATRADAHAHNVFAVDGAPRTAIADHTTGGIDWGRDEWHTVRLVRRGDRVEVFFDDLTEPVMTATDDRFRDGHLGLGSFDDRGRFARLRVWSPDARSGEATPFGSGRTRRGSNHRGHGGHGGKQPQRARR